MKSKEVYKLFELINYETNEEAKARMDTLVKVLKKWRDPDSKRVKIEKTSQPKKIK